MRPLRLRFYFIQYDGQEAEWTYAGLLPLLRSYPIAMLDIDPIAPTVVAPAAIDLSGGPQETDIDEDPWWISYIDLLAYLQGCCGSEDVDVNVGVLPQSVVGCWGVGGGGWMVTGMGCGGTYIHEMGHAFGIAHSSDSHGECDGGSCDPSWPTPHGGLGNYGWYGRWPDKLISPGVGAWHSHDRMSYGDCAEGAPAYDDVCVVYCAKWSSSLNYGRIGQRMWCFDPQWDFWTVWEFLGATFEFVDLGALVCYGNIGPFANLLTNPYWDLVGSSPELRSEGQLFQIASQPLQQPSAARAWISIRVDENGGAEIGPIYQLPADAGRSPHRALPSGAASAQQAPVDRRTLEEARSAGCTLQCLTLELRAADGAVLGIADVRASPLYSHSLVQRWTFNHAIPWHPQAIRIVLRRGEEVVAERAVSPTAPRVVFQNPNGGEVFANQEFVTVTWDAADGDGDQLSYWLQYSGDGGRTWSTIQRDLRATSYRVNLRGFSASSDALFRVLASDGVNTGVDTSDGVFSVASIPSRIGSLTGPLPGDALPLSD